MKKFYFLFAIVLISTFSQAQVVISQIYGGGGNTGATYTNDFIELFNRGTVAQNLSGWSVQYASANGTTWAVTQLPNFNLQPGKYYLIQQAAGSTPVLALPTPDLDGITCNCTYNTQTPPVLSTTGIAMSGSNGKVILVNSVTPESTANPTGAQIIDKVAFGTTSTSGFEGTGPTGTALTNSTSAIRNNAGCTDTDNNSTDFTAAAPVPKNSATAINTCILATNQNSISGLSVYPNPVKNGVFFINTDANAERTVTVFDVLGKQVLNLTTSNNAINVNNLNSGVYMVKITEEGKTATRKLVIE
ncbi:MAG: T9SS type A sorting domain-containing protein [Flavobacterium sp.]